MFNIKNIYNHLPANVKSVDSGFVIEVQVPGVKKEDVKVDISGKHLMVSVDESKSANEQDHWHLQEFTNTKRERVFYFRDQLNSDSASISMDNGILNINVSYLQPSNRKTLTLS